MLLEKPKQVDNGIYLYCPQEIIDIIDFRSETSELNKSGRIHRKFTVNQVKENTILVLNYLSNNITAKDEAISNYMATINCHTGLRRACNSKLCRFCIELLKKYKILYIRTRYGKETYLVGERSKQYRWNYTVKQFENMTSVYKHKVTHWAVVKKVMERLEELQCFKYTKRFLVKTNRKCRIYKKKPEKSKNPIQYMKNWCKYYHGYVEGMIYITEGKQKCIENQYKYGYQRLIFDRIGKIIDPHWYRRMSLDRVLGILDDIYGYYRKNMDKFMIVSSKSEIPF